MKIRTSALILAALMLLMSVACAAGNESEPETTVGTATGSDVSAETTVDNTPKFAEADYGGKDFIVYSRSSTAASYSGKYIDSDNVIDTMSEAVYLRNLAVEEKYNVVISTLEVDSPNANIRNHISAGEVPYDIVLDRRSYLGALAQEGYFYDFNNLENVDFSQAYWDSNAANGYEVAGKLFFMVNDVSVGNLAGARFFYFNKQLIKDYNLENPYDLVRDNKWTLDKFFSMVTSVSTDNGDGIWDGNDTYGMISEDGASNGNIMHLLVGCGIRFTEVNPDGTLTTNAYSEKTDTIMSKVAAGLLNNHFAITYQTASTGADTTNYANIYDFGRALFSQDHSLFIQGNMGVADQFREMKSDYGVVPNPKYDEAQESYYHKMDKFSLIWAIPKCNMDYDRLGVIVEYWAYQSSKTVMPAYYEITIKTKRVQEETASQMLDLIKGTILYDLSEVYSTDIASVLYSGYQTGKLSSSWASSKKIFDKSLTSIYEKISNLN
jgi:ABC-type glycerol-3-phosphate transport system substrate-binding protein